MNESGIFPAMFHQFLSCFFGKKPQNKLMMCHIQARWNFCWIQSQTGKKKKTMMIFMALKTNFEIFRQFLIDRKQKKLNYFTDWENGYIIIVVVVVVSVEW